MSLIQRRERLAQVLIGAVVIVLWLSLVICTAAALLGVW